MVARVADGPQGVDGPPGIRRWHWIRWLLVLAGVLALLGTFLWYEAFLEEGIYHGDAASNNQPQWFILAGLIVTVAFAVLAAARLPWRKFLLKAIAFQALGSLLLLAAWMAFLASMTFGHCGYSPSGAMWTDVGMYDQLPDAVLGEGEVFVHVPPPFGLAVVNVTQQLNLTFLSWTDAASGARLSMASRTVVQGLDANESATPQLQAAFQRFITNITADPAAGERLSGLLVREEMAAAYEPVDLPDGSVVFVPIYEYSVQLDVPQRIQELVPALLEDPAWTLGIQGPHREIRGPNGVPTLEADPDGTVEYERWADTDAEVHAWLVADLQRWGLAVPEETMPDGSIC